MHCNPPGPIRHLPDRGGLFPAVYPTRARTKPESEAYGYSAQNTGHQGAQPLNRMGVALIATTAKPIHGPG